MSFYPSGDPDTKITTKLVRENLPDAIISSSDHRGDLALELKQDSLRDALQLLKTDPALNYNLLLDVCGVDWLGQREPRFDLVYHLKSIPLTHRVRIKIGVEEDNAEVPSVVSIYKAAEWFEREAYDMYGIKFTDHPYLRRILTHEEFVGHPLRKDYEQTQRHACTRVSDLE